MWTITFIILLGVLSVASQNQTLPSSFPQDYPGKPTTDFGPDWQDYFQVTGPLPNVSFPLPRSFAGNIPVQRANHPNNTLFFWAFERENGSLTAAAGDQSGKPWAIWLQGGPGGSSLAGLLIENGPLHVASGNTTFANNYSWNQFADYVWIDQPVGTGFSTVDETGYVANEDMVVDDFIGFLDNFVKVFPSIATRPLYLTGESYAGVFIPYITKRLFEMQNPPVRLSKIAMGDPLLSSQIVSEILPATAVLETYPQLIGYDTAVYNYFKEQEHLCGYDLNLSYPETGPLPDLKFIAGAAAGNSSTTQKFSALTKRTFMAELESRHSARSLVKRETSHVGKRDLSDRANGTIDPWYGCDLFDEIIDYAINFSYPWSLSKSSPTLGFDFYSIPDALDPEAPSDPSLFLNDETTRAAIHAPTSKDWVEIFGPAFGHQEDPSPAPAIFLSDLATNATAHNVTIILYSGNDDYILPHRGTEVVIQNTTFGGIQGFTQKPSTPWSDDAGNFAGIVHQERNWTYILVAKAGHLLAQTNPASAYVAFREFVFGNNQTGLVTNSSGKVSVVGGTNATYADGMIRGQDGIFYGSGTTQSTFSYPTATVAAWNSFIQTATAATTTTTAAASRNAAGRIMDSVPFPAIIVAVVVSLLLPGL